jgi:hypothetical protein
MSVLALKFDGKRLEIVSVSSGVQKVAPTQRKRKRPRQIRSTALVPLVAVRPQLFPSWGAVEGNHRLGRALERKAGCEFSLPFRRANSLKARRRNNDEGRWQNVNAWLNAVSLAIQQRT